MSLSSVSQWDAISKKYAKERDSFSQSSMLLDPLIKNYFEQHRGANVLDYGAGSGTQARLISPYTTKIVAYEPTEAMRRILLEKTPLSHYKNIQIIDNREDLSRVGLFDVILCSKVLDHISDVPQVLKEMHGLLKEKGVLLLSIPHPIKYSGVWDKENGKYNYYKMDNYFQEKEIVRSRENMFGETFITEVRCFHRTISTYYNWLICAGFCVSKILEPQPATQLDSAMKYLSEQSSRIPNLLFFECFKNEIMYKTSTIHE